MDEDKLIEQTETTIRQVDELVRKALARVEETDEMLKKAGLERGMGDRFLQLDHVSPADKERARQEMEQWNQEIEAEIAGVLAQSKEPEGVGKARVGMKKGMMRI